MAKNKRESIGEVISESSEPVGGSSIQEQYSDVLKRREASKSADITMKVSVDVSEALTGLKAVERQAKAATRALRELEEVQTRFDKDGNMTMNGAKITFPGDEVE